MLSVGGVRRRAKVAALALLAVLGGCASPDEVTVRSVAPAWKSPAMQMSERRNCEYRARGLAEPYADCLRRLGYQVEILYPDGPPPSSTPARPTYSPPVTAYAPPAYRPPVVTPPPSYSPPSYSPPSYSPPLEPPPRYEPPPDPPKRSVSPPEELAASRSAGSAQSVCVVRSLDNIVRQYRMEIFRVAHPSGQVDEIGSQINSSTEGRAVVLHQTNWRGRATGKSYQTALRFTFDYRSPTLVDSVSVDALENNNPFPPAFLASEAAKQALLHFVSDKLKERGLLPASIAARIINSSMSVKGALTEGLKYAASHACGGV